MLLPSEIEAKSILPAIRAILACKLLNEYGHKEEEVARALGITQAAVSNYSRCIRGDRRDYLENCFCSRVNVHDR
jgi:predicted transcriptional regulator